MHADAAEPSSDAAWSSYFARLRASGAFEGGSAIGPGEVVRKDGAARPTTNHLSGYIRIRADSLDDAKRLVRGNPVFESGGSVEVRTLPQD